MALELGISDKCKTMADELIKSFATLSLAEDRAAMGYTGDTERLVKTALRQLERTGIDPEDIQDATEPLQAISSETRRGDIHSRIREAQEEILAIAGPFICACILPRDKDSSPST